MSKTSRRTDRNIRAMTFIDSTERIAFSKWICVLGDGHFCNLMQSLGFEKRPETFRIVGSMVTLGDFRVRDGIAISKEHADKVCGLVLDVAYLPIELLSADYSKLFTSRYTKIWKDRPRFEFPQKEQGQKYDTLHL
jgi:hypothetical protein